METCGNKITYSRLPKQLPVKKLGKEYKNLEGYVKIDSLARVNDLFASDDTKTGQAELLVKLSFAVKSNSIITVEGKINQEVMLSCQRCLSALSYDINADLKVVITNNVERQDIAHSDYEPVILNYTDMLDLYQIVEDELILSLPIVPKHDEGSSQCVAQEEFLI